MMQGFENEIAIFVQGDGDVSPIQRDYREELMPVLLRLLYGKIVAKQGASASHQGLQAKRAMVLRSLGGFSSDEIKDFIGIALGPLSSINLQILLSASELHQQLEMPSPRKQLGFLNMAEDLIKSLGFNLSPLTKTFVVPILAILIHSIASPVKSQDAMDDHMMQIEGQSALSRSLRQSGFKCPQSPFLKLSRI